MRAFIIATLDVLAVLLVIVFTLVGAGVGLSSYGSEGQKIVLLIVGLVGGFACGALISGSVLALTEIARNTRRTVELLEKIAGR